jgi:hypothetical protein
VITRESISHMTIGAQEDLFADILREIPGNYDSYNPAAWLGVYGFDIADREHLSFGLQVNATSLQILDHLPTNAPTVRQPLLTFLTLTAAHDFSPAELLNSAPAWMLSGAVDEVWGRIGRLMSFTPPDLKHHIEWLEARSPVEEVLLVAVEGESGQWRNARRKRLPCLVRSAVADWPLATLSASDFITTFGQLSFSDVLADGARRATLGQLLPDAKPSEMFADLCRPGNWGTGILPESLKEMVGNLPHNVEVELGIRPSQAGNVESFLCGTGADTPLHTDLVNGCLTCALGPRQLLLFGPSQARAIYACKNLELGDYRKSHIENCREVDTTKFTSFLAARPIRITLHPGDLLYLPAGWFHYVYVTGGPSLSLKFSMSMVETWADGPGTL